MYSKSFLKFLYGYQKEDFEPKKSEKYEIYFDKKNNGKPAEVLVQAENKS